MSPALKNAAAMIVALTGLVTAVGAIVRKPPEDAAREGYIELTKAILDTQAATKADHDDLVELHKFVADYVGSHRAVVIEQTIDGGVGARVDLSTPKSTTKVALVTAAPSSVQPPVIVARPAPAPPRAAMDMRW